MKVPTDKLISLLFPVYNEEDLILKVVNKWIKFVLKKLPSKSEILFDDCSNDDTPKILKKLCKGNKQLRYHYNKRDGFQNAIKRMAKKAKNNYIFMTDSDGQYPVNSFWELYKHMNYFDIVTGFKKIRYDKYYRKILSYFFNTLISFIFFFKLKNEDYNCFYKIIKRKDFLNLDKKVIYLRKRFPTTEFYLLSEYNNLNIKRVPIKSLPRGGKKKSNALPISIILKIVIPTIFNLIILRLNIKKKIKKL